jgi:c-di-GMP-binding flagellar brake protein YcgR
MGQDDGNGFDFEVSKPSEDVSATSRQAYRLPISEKDNVTFQVGGQSFEVVNISATGIAIRLDAPDTFSRDDVLDDVDVNLQGESLKLQAKVCHISFQFENHGGYICGLMFLGLDKDSENYRKLNVFVETRQKQLFKKE